MDKQRKPRPKGLSKGHYTRAKSCLINDRIFTFQKDAADYADVDVGVIKQRCDSEKYPNYQWIVIGIDSPI